APTTYTITATSVVDPSKSATATITVTEVTDVKILPMSAVVLQGSTVQLSADVTVTGAVYQTVTWSSTSSVVTVDEDGLVTIASDATPGQYIITATSTEDASKQGIATITVIKIAGISITPN